MWALDNLWRSRCLILALQNSYLLLLFFKRLRLLLVRSNDIRLATAEIFER